MKDYKFLPHILLVVIWTTKGIWNRNIIFQIQNSLIIPSFDHRFISYNFFETCLVESTTTSYLPNQRDTPVSQKNLGMAGESVADEPTATQSTDIASTTSATTMVATTMKTSGEMILNMDLLYNYYN